MVVAELSVVPHTLPYPGHHRLRSGYVMYCLECQSLVANCQYCPRKCAEDMSDQFSRIRDDFCDTYRDGSVLFFAEYDRLRSTLQH
ncbi:hypothetical protein Q1695_006041 [Nippostrongylus brasiliensis]|nr:hypothetical protein Q1695_006041 [Nippostrongylus brasiliensis]